MTNNDATDDKLNFEDISFDDMIDGGIQTTEVSEEAVAEKPVEEVQEEVQEEAKEATNELDADAEQIQEEPTAETEYKELGDKKEEAPITEEQQEISNTVVSEVLGKLGYEVETDYPDTEEGLVEMTKDIGAQIAQDHMKQLMEEFPMVRQHLEYVMAGGESKSFMSAFDPQQDYANVKINETNAPLQKMLVSNYFKMKGHDDSFIKELIEDYEDGGKLQSKAEQAQKALVNAQRSQQQNMLKRQQQVAQKTQIEQRKFWNNVYDTIEQSREFSGIVVPEKDKKSFFKYLSAPIDKQGSTKRDVDHAQSSLETKLAIDYLMFKGFKLDDIIKSKMGTEKAKDLRSRIARQQERTKSAKRPTRRNTGFDIEDLDLSVI